MFFNRVHGPPYAINARDSLRELFQCFLSNATLFVSLPLVGSYDGWTVRKHQNQKYAYGHDQRKGYKEVIFFKKINLYPHNGFYIKIIIKLIYSLTR